MPVPFRLLSLLAAGCLTTAAGAHGTQAPPPDRTRAAWHWLELVAAPAYAATASITLEGDYRVIRADGLPDHETGAFPNPGNPNRIRAQHYEARVPARPQPAAQATPLGLRNFGFAVNGVPFDPGAAEFWNGDRNWQYEAMSGAVPLGLDRNNAHVQPSGAYHYHGLPAALLARFAGAGGPVLLGWAADGFPIYGPLGYADAGTRSARLVALRPGWRLKSGTRAGGPGGRHDGSFVQDYEFVAGLGDLDECNGRRGVTPEFPAGTYHYVLTDSYPFIPRCFRGTPDPSFARGPRAGAAAGAAAAPEAGRGPPPAALEACRGRGAGAPCSFGGPRGEPLEGSCFDPPGGAPRACRPLHAPPGKR